MTTFFTADQHFGHELMRRLRGFETTALMDAAIVAAWNRRVTNGDIVYVLGDVSMNIKNLAPVKDLQGTKILVAGNHDACYHRRSKRKDVRKALEKVSAYYEAGFTMVVTSGQMLYRDVKNVFMLSHLPVYGDHEQEQRYNDRRPRSGELPLACGHVHHAWKTQERMVNVGIDTNETMSPYSLEEVLTTFHRLTGTGAAAEVVLPGVWNEFGLA